MTMMKMTNNIHLSTDRSRGVDNDHSKGRNQCEMQLLWEPSTVAGNALELWWWLWWWWGYDDDDYEYEDVLMMMRMMMMSQWCKVGIMGIMRMNERISTIEKLDFWREKTHGKSYARGSPVSHSTSTRGVWSAWQVWKVFKKIAQSTEMNCSIGLYNCIVIQIYYHCEPFIWR